MTSAVESTKPNEIELLRDLSYINEFLDRLPPAMEYGSSMAYTLDTEERSSIKTILRGLND